MKFLHISKRPIENREIEVQLSNQTVQSAQTLVKFQNTECLTAYNAHFNRNMNGSHGLPALYWNRRHNREPYNGSTVYMPPFGGIKRYIQNIHHHRDVPNPETLHVGQRIC